MSEFKVGDRVRRKIDDIGTGRRGTIKRIAEPCITQYPVMVDWDDGGEYGAWLSHDQIAPDIDVHDTNVVDMPEAVESEGDDTVNWKQMYLEAKQLADDSIKFAKDLREEKTFTGLAERYGVDEVNQLFYGENGGSPQHNDHYTKLGDYEPFKVYEAFVDGNEELFQDNPKLAGYYLNVIKYLARINSKDTPLKNMEKACVYLDKLIAILENEDGRN